MPCLKKREKWIIHENRGEDISGLVVECRDPKQMVLCDRGSGSLVENVPVLSHAPWLHTHAPLGPAARAYHKEGLNTFRSSLSLCSLLRITVFVRPPLSLQEKGMDGWEVVTERTVWSHYILCSSWKQKHETGILSILEWIPIAANSIKVSVLA